MQPNGVQIQPSMDYAHLSWKRKLSHLRTNLILAQSPFIPVHFVCVCVCPHEYGQTACKAFYTAGILGTPLGYRIVVYSILLSLKNVLNTCKCTGVCMRALACVRAPVHSYVSSFKGKTTELIAFDGIANKNLQVF